MRHRQARVAGVAPSGPRPSTACGSCRSQSWSTIGGGRWRLPCRTTYPPALRARSCYGVSCRVTSRGVERRLGVRRRAARRRGARPRRPGRAPGRPSARGRRASRPRRGSSVMNCVIGPIDSRDEDVEARAASAPRRSRRPRPRGSDVLDAARLRAGPAASSVLTTTGIDAARPRCRVSRSSARTASLTPTTKCLVPQYVAPPGKPPLPARRGDVDEVAAAAGRACAAATSFMPYITPWTLMSTCRCVVASSSSTNGGRAA